MFRSFSEDSTIHDDHALLVTDLSKTADSALRTEKKARALLLERRDGANVVAQILRDTCESDPGRENNQVLECTSRAR